MSKSCYLSLIPDGLEVDLVVLKQQYEIASKLGADLSDADYDYWEGLLGMIEEIMDACALTDDGEQNEDFIEVFGSDWRSSDIGR